MSSVNLNPTSEEPGVAKIFSLATQSINIFVINPFYKTRLIYQISQHIADQRQLLLKDLVAYSKDPVRYRRRIRMLIQLAEYEHQIIKKINNFDTDNEEDIGQYDALSQLKQEVDILVNRSS